MRLIPIQLVPSTIAAALSSTDLWSDAQVCEHIVEDELLDLEIHHHVPVELALEQPPQRLQVGDIVPYLGLAAGSASAARRHRPEEQPRRIELSRRCRPASPRLERTVIDHYRNRRVRLKLCRELEHWIGRIFGILKCKNFTNLIRFRGHFEYVSQ